MAERPLIPKKPEHLRLPKENPFEESNPFEVEDTQTSVEDTQKRTSNPFESEWEKINFERPQLPPRPKVVSEANLTRPPLPDRPEVNLHRSETILINTLSSNINLSVSPPLSLSTTFKALIPDSRMTFKISPIATYLPTTEVKIIQPTKQLLTGLVSLRGFEMCANGRVIYVPSNDTIATFDVISSFINTEHRWILSASGGDVTLTDLESGETGKTFAHSSPVVFIIDCDWGVVTVDEGGGVRVWQLSATVGEFLAHRPRAIRVSSKPSIVLVSSKNEMLYTNNGKILEVYTLKEELGTILKAKVDCVGGVGFGNGNVICMALGTVFQSKSPTNTQMEVTELLFMGFDTGHVSIYDNTERIAVIQLTQYKITCMCMCENRLWVGLGTGKILVLEFDWSLENAIGCSQVTIVLEFQAHHNSAVLQLITHKKSTSGNETVASVSQDSVKFWDGLLLELHALKLLLEKEQDYSSYTNIRIQMLTFNIDSRKPVDLDATLHDRTIFEQLFETESDIYVFGFQELVDLENKSVSAKTFLKGAKTGGDLKSKADARMVAWKERILKMFPDRRVTVVQCAQLVGLFQLIVTKGLVVREVELQFVKTGLGGLHGNKGALVTRFLLGDSGFVFVNCHLAAHQSEVLARNNDIHQILKDCTFSIPNAKLFWNRGGDGTKILDYEFVIWSGDMNYRIDLSRNQTISQIQKGDLEPLWQNDQLLKQFQTNPGFGLRDFKEAPLQFNPTFKYERNSTSYEVEKMRVPAYCDRILYKFDQYTKREKVRVLEYKSLDIRMSDHRPVKAILDFDVKKVDGNKLSDIEATVWNIVRGMKKG